jgi:hypothetical protein
MIARLPLHKIRPGIGLVLFYAEIEIFEVVQRRQSLNA